MLMPVNSLKMSAIIVECRSLLLSVGQSYCSLFSTFYKCTLLNTLPSSQVNGHSKWEGMLFEVTTNEFTHISHANTTMDRDR